MKIQSFGEGVRTVLSIARRLVIHSFMHSCKLLPIDKNKIVIMNYYGSGFGDNGKVIAEELHKQKPDLKIVWPVTKANKNKLPDYCSPVIFRSLKYYREMATAAIWVDNSRKAADIVKRKNQFYIQTWHGMVALKKIEKDAEDRLTHGYIVDAKHDSKLADVILSGCQFFTELCKRAFWYDGEIMESGSPRLDILFKSSDRKTSRVKERLGVSADKKIVLYVPTFRADENTDCYIRNYQEILNALCAKTDNDWVFAVRLHPNITNKAGFITYSDRIVNATSFPDLYELIPAADIIISDYSSLMFDSGLINKPVFLYATDIEAYKADRGFYFQLDSLPFPLATDSNELIEKISTFDETKYFSDLQKFNSHIGYFENGTATKTVVNRILKELK